MRVFFRSVFNSGRGSTKAGLTLAVNIDKSSGVKRLEAGSYPLASSKHGGIVVIDELEKMDKEEHQILAEVMDDEQTTSKNAAGFHVTLDIRCASIHCANPVLKETNGRYDRTKTLLENSGMDAWLLSRYDAVFVFTDEIDAKSDEEKVKHWMSHFNLSVAEEQYDSSAKYMTMTGLSNDEDYWPVAFMRYWGHYVRETFHPRLDPNSEAGQELMNFYLKLRKGSQQFGTKITMRDLGALIRFSEASARAHHRNEVLVKDAKLAIDLVSTAIASSGFNPATGQTMLDVPQRQKQMDARKGRIAAFVHGVNEVSKKECEACHGTGNVPMGPSSAYGSFGEKCELCTEGYVDGQSFTGTQLVKNLAKKMSEDEVRAYLKDANDKMLLIYSGNDTYKKIPGRWMEYCVKQLPMEFGSL
jgi:DNA replicative helicase MCM subunit Mcm2 (Cdc46/Mcm family)